MSEVRLELPWPPSVNTYWRHVLIKRKPRTLISKKGREYRESVAARVLEQRGNKGLSCRLSVEVDAHVPDQRQRDIDNICKGLLDALTHAGVWGDDSQIDRLLVTRKERVNGGLVVVTIREAA